MISPSWSFAEVFALNALQKSMMFTPCCPSAGPTGGAGVALPAGICSLTCPITFFAILFSRYATSSPLEGNPVQPGWPDRRWNHDLQRVSIGVHFIDDTG